MSEQVLADVYTYPVKGVNLSVAMSPSFYVGNAVDSLDPVADFHPARPAVLPSPTVHTVNRPRPRLHSTDRVNRRIALKTMTALVWTCGRVQVHGLQASDGGYVAVGKGTESDGSQAHHHAHSPYYNSS